jgi:hypothetical protein
MARQLKLWNGRPYGVLPRGEWKDAHIYVAAYSAADARRVCLEAGLYDPGAREISEYWNAGCWGNSMYSVTPERGVWIGHGRNPPVRRAAPTPKD